ncbi:MAG: hypothetical protein AAB610_00320 [Patescibacteria group bacterium]
MELKEFIKKSLLDIRTGIREGNKEIIKELGGEGPFTLGDMKSKIDFDIAVSVEENISGKVGGGIKIVAVNIGSNIEGNSKSSNVSRIKFSIFTAFNFLS